MTERRVVVDDTNPQIQYSGKWYLDSQNLDNVGNFGTPFQHTSHGTNTNSSGLSLQFQGSYPQVFGTNSVKSLTGALDPSWTCLVDGVDIGRTSRFNFPINNFLLCDGKNVTDGNHTLTINVTMSHESFWFDYVTYIPSTTVSLESAIVRVERLDPAIVYDSGWGDLGNFSNFTFTNGSQLKFDFIGKSVSWIGYIPREFALDPTSARYSIDGGKPESFRLNGLSDNSTSVYNQVFFTTPDLTPGHHSLLVTHDGQRNQTPLTLNYLLVANASAPSLPPVTSSTPTPSNSSKPSSSVPVGAIIGAVVGGVAVLCIVAFFIWRRTRQRRVIVYDRADIDPDDDTIPSHSSTITPFNPQSSDSVMAETSIHNSNIYYTAVANPSKIDRHHTRGSSQGGSASNPTEDLSARQNPVRQKVPPRPPPTVRVHEDSGVRGVTDEEVVELPPNYTPG
ncbi:hypothetical protein BD779DRAFT_212451 [Infundibulicybe gibba]|nr:hypothetical protein BD779DRAFT_212451 [Infundibulicybe gibba]